MNINLRPQDIQMTIKEVRPTVMCSVPRFWEKVYSGVNEVIASATGVKKTLMQDAIKVGREHNVNYVFKGKTPPLWLHMKYKFYEKTIYSLLKKTLGLDRGSFFPTAGAAIPPAVQEFVLSVGINMLAGYGLTESIATVSCENLYDHEIGSVGKLMPHMQVKFGENDEILLKGPAITKGYYKKEAVTKASFTEDGWFRTGDAGYIKDGFLFLTERIKDLFKTSNGKYIAPQAIETKMVVDRYIDQISIIADERKFVAALIVPDYKLVEKFAADKGIQYASMAELLKHDAVMELFKERIDTLQQQFAHYEQIKKFTLLPEPFSMAKGELTNTLKIKRSVLNKNYAAEIEAMYSE
jgi:long-chain acyl-CoA synthetase